MAKCEIKSKTKYECDRKKIGFWVEDTTYNAMLAICGEEDLFITEYMNMLINADIEDRNSL